jgi:hypothetical protein
MIENRTIPEFLIESNDAAKLKTFADDEEMSGAVHLKINLSLSHPDNHVEVELWFSSLIDFPESILKGMAHYHKLLGNDVSFVPRIATYSCEECPHDII